MNNVSQWPKEKKTNIDLQSILIKLKISYIVTFGLDRIMVYSEFGVDRILVYSRLGLDRILVYSGFSLDRILVYSGLV